MKYKVKNSDILHGGKLYKEGELIELSDEHAKEISLYIEKVERVVEEPEEALEFKGEQSEEKASEADNSMNETKTNKKGGKK